MARQSYDSDEEDDWESDETAPWDEDDTDETFPCPHCGKSVYEDAEWCPHCDQYLSAEEQAANRKPLWMWIIVALLIASLAWVALAQ